MLVISRRPSERIVLRGDIEIEILELRGSSVLLGIQAPRKIKIIRQELLSPEPNQPTSKVKQTRKPLDKS